MATYRWYCTSILDYVLLLLLNESPVSDCFVSEIRHRCRACLFLGVMLYTWVTSRMSWTLTRPLLRCTSQTLHFLEDSSINPLQHSTTKMNEHVSKYSTALLFTSTLLQHGSCTCHVSQRYFNHHILLHVHKEKTAPVDTLWFWYNL